MRDNEAFFVKIWQDLKVSLRRFISSRVPGDWIDDILHEVNEKYWMHVKANRDIQSPKSWLFQVTRITIADFYRSQKINTTTYPEDLVKLNPGTSTCVCDLTEFVIRTYLSPEYAVPLILSDIEQKPQKEVAALTGLTLTATKSRVQRGRKKLRKLIEGCLEINYNASGQISDFQLKEGCRLPPELVAEAERLSIEL